MVHVYQLKPRQKRTGLFKGWIYVDAHTGSLVRAEGRPVKSPSVFIKKIDFVQDYADFSPFTLPVHIHSEATAHIVGRAIVDVYQRDYQPVADAVLNTAVIARRIPALIRIRQSTIMNRQCIGADCHGTNIGVSFTKKSESKLWS